MFLTVRRRPALGWLWLSLVLAGCSKPLSAEECDQLLDHYTERLLRESAPELTGAQVAERQRQARTLARERAEFEFDKCANRVSRSQFRCALEAGSVDQVERCLL